MAFAHPFVDPVDGVASSPKNGVDHVDRTTRYVYCSSFSISGLYVVDVKVCDWVAERGLRTFATVTSTVMD